MALWIKICSLNHLLTSINLTLEYTINKNVVQIVFIKKDSVDEN